MKNLTIAILCGGKSSRMGTDKANLLWNKETFLQHITNNLKGEEPMLYSVAGGRRYHLEERVNYVEDRYENCGPLGGLHALLCACETELLFVAAVDTPLIERRLMEELLGFLSPAVDAVIPVEEDGRLHPLCAVYRKEMKEIVEEQLRKGDYKVRNMLQRIRVCYVPVKKLAYGNKKLLNVNTPEDYKAYAGKEVCPVFSVAAYSGSGKTTFLEQVIRELKKRKVRVAVIKHNGHDHEIDVPGKDTYRFGQAGADSVLFVSGTKTARMDYFPKEMPELLGELRNVDLILIEGYKHENYRKILYYREEAGTELAVNLKEEQPELIVSDRKEWPNADCPVVGIEEAEKAAEFLLSKIIFA